MNNLSDSESQTDDMPEPGMLASEVLAIRKQAVMAKTDVSIPFNTFARKYFPILSQLEDIQLYRIHKSEILSGAQKTILKFALSEEKLKKATFLQLCQGFEILNKAERLERNLSSENVSHRLFGSLELLNK